MAAKTRKTKERRQPKEPGPFDEILHPRKRAFLVAYVGTISVSAACEAAKVTRQAHWHWTKSDPDFVAAFERAKDMARETLEAEASRRAIEGVPRMKFHNGQPIMVPAIGKNGLPVLRKGEPVLVPYIEREYSDTLLIFRMKGEMPGKYREKSDVNVGVNVGVQVIETDDWYGTKAAISNAPPGDGASTFNPAVTSEVQGRHLRASVGKNGSRSNGHAQGPRSIPGPEEGSDRRGEDLVGGTDLQGGLENLEGPEESDEGGMGREE